MIRYDEKGRIIYKAADNDVDIFGYGKEDEIRLAYDDENNGVYKKTTSSDGKEEITITFYDSDNKVRFERFISRGHVDTHHIYLDENVEIIIKKPLDGTETITILKNGLHIRSINIFENERLLNELMIKGAEEYAKDGMMDLPFNVKHCKK